MTVERTHILILNYNGRELLAECLPSILEAASGSPVPCAVSVIDNDSTDGSREMIAARWPEVRVFHEENRGLASFNHVLTALDEPVVLLLNNDVKLAANSIGPLLDAIASHPDALFSAPLCWTFDGQDYEGMRTRVRSRFGLVQGMSRVPGVENFIHQADLTAAAGPILAVDRVKFLEVGGYDPVYFPGRIEDLDLGFRGWMAGYRGYYEPESLAFHRGLATFGREFGTSGCDRLAIRNSFLFAWKNLGGRRLWSHLFWIAPRMAYWLIRGRFSFATSLFSAFTHWNEIRLARRAMAVGQGTWIERQESFFRRFDW